MTVVAAQRTQVAINTPFEPNRNPGYGGVASDIESSDVQNAIEEVFQNAPGKLARFTVGLLNNSTLTNGQRFTRSELLPNTQVLVPYKCELKAIAFSCSNANADWQFNFYKYTKVSGYVTGTLLFSRSAVNQNTYTENGLSYSFDEGDEIRVIFIDTGNNPSDASMDLYFQIAE